MYRTDDCACRRTTCAQSVEAGVDAPSTATHVVIDSVCYEVLGRGVVASFVIIVDYVTHHHSHECLGPWNGDVCVMRERGRWWFAQDFTHGPELRAVTIRRECAL